MRYKDFLYSWRPDSDYVKYIKWRRAVFTRDHGECQWCGVRTGERHADHILPWATHPDHRYAVSNGRVLCLVCHRKRHEGMWYPPDPITRRQRRYAQEIAAELGTERGRGFARAETLAIDPVFLARWTPFRRTAAPASSLLVPHPPTLNWWQ